MVGIKKRKVNKTKYKCYLCNYTGALSALMSNHRRYQHSDIDKATFRKEAYESNGLECPDNKTKQPLPEASKKIYNCHLCDYSGKLFAVCGSHRNYQHPEENKAEFKKQVFIHNGREIKKCLHCNEELDIFNQNDSYHKKCVGLAHTGENNPIYKGNKQEVPCTWCNKPLIRYLREEDKKFFCGAVCREEYYKIWENKTDKQKEAYADRQERFKSYHTNPYYKKKQLEGLLNAFKDQMSGVEKEFNEELKKQVDIETQVVINAYQTADIFIPSRNHYVEVQGNYFHSRMTRRQSDCVKAGAIKNQTGYELYPIWENEIRWLGTEKAVEWLYKPVDIYIVIGDFKGDHSKYNIQYSLSDCIGPSTLPYLCILDKYKRKDVVSRMKQNNLRIWTFFIDGHKGPFTYEYSHGVFKTNKHLKRYLKKVPFSRYGK